MKPVRTRRCTRRKQTGRPRTDGCGPWGDPVPIGIHGDTYASNYLLRADPYPSSCGVELLNYFKLAFDRAVLVVTLEDKNRETLVLRLRAMAPTYEEIKGRG